MKYFWLNIQDGTFSNSWGEETMKSFSENDLEQLNKDALAKGFRLIKYECLNDSNFEFDKNFKLK